MNESKEHIILVACRLFLQKNFKEVTMKELVEKTGLSKGAFYHYFSSKEQLFMEVLNFFFLDVMIHNYASYSKDSFYQFYHDYANEVRSYSKYYLEKFFEGENQTEEEVSLNYFTLAFDALKMFPEFKLKMNQGLNDELEIWKGVIKTAREKGEIKTTMTDEEIARTYISVSDGVAMHMIIKGVSFDDMVAPFLKLWDKLYEQIKA